MLSVPMDTNRKGIGVKRDKRGTEGSIHRLTLCCNLDHLGEREKDGEYQLPEKVGDTYFTRPLHRSLGFGAHPLLHPKFMCYPLLQEQRPQLSVRERISQIAKQAKAQSEHRIRAFLVLLQCVEDQIGDPVGVWQEHIDYRQVREQNREWRKISHLSVCSSAQ